jgi:hypothetical protein
MEIIITIIIIMSMFSFLVGTAVGAWAMNGYIMNKAYNGQVPWMDQKCWRSTW